MSFDGAWEKRASTLPLGSPFRGGPYNFDCKYKNRHNVNMTILNSPQETFAYGKKLAAKLKGGDILLLSGDLGAGKTALVKGIAAGLGIKKELTSPTFSLLNIYPISHKQSAISQLVHIDTYRLKDEKELLEIGVEDYLGRPDTICAIEWPEKIQNLLKGKKTTTIALEHGDKPEERKISIA